ncbi:MAG: GDP-mannose 4,6-dehydratase, partial [Candidatus Sungbacteria bacterium]|nr:GDP-mannose 4,6-dehydratase [Candidatus Sungbacteria bacterium]
DRHAVQEAVARADAIVNFAAHSHVDRSIQTTRPFHDTNAGGVINILDSLKSLKSAMRFIARADKFLLKQTGQQCVIFHYQYFRPGMRPASTCI